MNNNTLDIGKLLELRLILSLLQPVCGAVILMCFSRWLSRRQVKDMSLTWLILGLLSLVPAPILQLAGWGGDNHVLIGYLFSPISNVLLTITAFELLRVKEEIGRRGFQSWTTLVVWLVIGASVIVELMLVLVLTVRPHESLKFVALQIDAVTSSVAIIALMASIAYSFYRYGNQPLMGLTLANFTYIAWYQFYLAWNKGQPPDNLILIAVDITSVAFMTMLFIALVLAWGLSNTSRLKFRKIEAANVVALVIDLCGSTECTNKVWAKGDGALIVDFKNKFCDWATALVSEAQCEPRNAKFMDARFMTVKFTGDGLIFVLEVDDASKIINIANAVVGLGCALHGGYPSWLEKYGGAWADVPKAIGVGVDFGYAHRLTTENGTYDYSGLPLDFAVKMQALARPYGGVVIQAKWALPNELRSKFTKKGVMRVGNKRVPVRATGRVKLPQPDFDQPGMGNIGLN